MQPLAVLLDRWKIESVDPVPPATGAEVRRVFSELGSVATEDVIALYEAVGGMNVMDNAMWRLWSLAEVQAENSPGSANGILFSDYLIASWAYRLKPEDEFRSSVYVDYFDGNEPLLVAGSLHDFFSKYVADAARLLEPMS